MIQIRLKSNGSTTLVHKKMALRTQPANGRGVEGGEESEVGVEVVHLPQPLHHLDKLHHVPLTLLNKQTKIMPKIKCHTCIALAV